MLHNPCTFLVPSCLGTHVFEVPLRELPSDKRRVFEQSVRFDTKASIQPVEATQEQFGDHEAMDWWQGWLDVVCHPMKRSFKDGRSQAELGNE